MQRFAAKSYRPGVPGFEHITKPGQELTADAVGSFMEYASEYMDVTIEVDSYGTFADVTVRHPDGLTIPFLAA